MATGASIPKEVLFLWSDLELLKNQNEEERERMTNDIWTGYFEKSTSIRGSHESLSDLYAQFLAGKPSATVLDKISEETLQRIISLSLSEAVCSFCTASMYSKRYHGVFTTLPYQLFEKMYVEFGSPQWKRVTKSDGIKVFKRNLPGYQGVFVKFGGVLQVPATRAADFVMDISQRKRVQKEVKESEVLEQLGPDTHLSYMRRKLLGELKDFYFVMSRMTFSSGVIGILTCSVDHPSSESQTMKIDFGGWNITPLSETTCYYEESIMFQPLGQKLLRVLAKSEWVLGKAGIRIFSTVRKVIES